MFSSCKLPNVLFKLVYITILNILQKTGTITFQNPPESGPEHVVESPQSLYFCSRLCNTLDKLYHLEDQNFVVVVRLLVLNWAVTHQLVSPYLHFGFSDDFAHILKKKFNVSKIHHIYITKIKY